MMIKILTSRNQFWVEMGFYAGFSPHPAPRFNGSGEGEEKGGRGERVLERWGRDLRLLLNPH